MPPSRRKGSVRGGSRAALREVGQPRSQQTPPQPSRPATSTTRTMKRTAREAELDGEDEGEGEDGSDATAPPAKYPTLQARVQHISQDAVTSKWTPLSASAQERVLAVLQTVERPATTRHRDQKRRTEAQAALAPVLRTLRRKLPRMAFPPTTKDAHFDYESMLDSNRALDAQLTPATHTIDVLRGEIAREEDLLAVEKARLAAIERDAAAEESMRKRQAKSMHPLLRRSAKAAPPGEANDDLLEGIGLVAAPNKPARTGPLEQLGAEPRLAGLMKQLQDHLESMQGNVEPLQGVGEAVVRARAAVDDALYRHLDGRQYERAVAGSG
ncbi:MAG: hypothetical protein M1832_004006 [Thelocarpon impressellum]|nr:MAG: hypothetical protein M1832_004006 [Thelocarpon impressellum]